MKFQTPTAALASAALLGLAAAEVPQEHSHEKYLVAVNQLLAQDNPSNIVDAVFGLLGNAAAAEGAGDITNLDCLHQATADSAFSTAKAAGDVDGMASALVFRAIERNTGSVGLKSVICDETAANPEIAALSQHQDPASEGAAEENKAITLELARQLAAVGADPLLALESGTFEPGDLNDATGAGNTCDDIDDPVGCIFTKGLLVEDATPEEIQAAVADVAGGAGGNAGNAGNGTAADGAGCAATNSTIAAHRRRVRRTSSSLSVVRRSSGRDVKVAARGSGNRNANGNANADGNAGNNGNNQNDNGNTGNGGAANDNAGNNNNNSDNTANDGVGNGNADNQNNGNADDAGDAVNDNTGNNNNNDNNSANNGNDNGNNQTNGNGNNQNNGNGDDAANDNAGNDNGNGNANNNNNNQNNNNNNNGNQDNSGNADDTGADDAADDNTGNNNANADDAADEVVDDNTGNGNNNGNNNQNGNNQNDNADANNGGNGAATGTADVQTFTGNLGGPPPPVVSSAADKPFEVNGDTFLNAGAALQRSCAVQHNACANAANSGSADVSVADCDAQEDDCLAAASLKKLRRSSSVGSQGRRMRIASRASVKSRQAGLDFGECQDPSIQFVEGLDGRQEASFGPVGDFQHGSALNINIISSFVCGQLQSRCKAGDEAVAACEEGQADAQGLEGQAAADAFNAALGL
ncbi:hypothetical protein CSOJ01_09696 [Colletotrichum sojae]|uniref:Uncharacterized protein n=1 Tax=Colletotrichum sojae TaxID=2175907 RepID=A0A8H6MQC6_9PEZI|nr:hypothetical protein CSOJ01_09696 [Colletotrichum sojae]